MVHRMASTVLSISLLAVVLSTGTTALSVSSTSSRTIPKEQALFELDNGRLILGSRSAKRRLLNASHKVAKDLSKLAQEHKELVKMIEVLRKPAHRAEEAELKRLKRRKLVVEDMSKALRKQSLRVDVSSIDDSSESSSSSTRLGVGGFADVLLGHYVEQSNNKEGSEKQPVAVKVSRSKEDAGLLLREAELLLRLDRFPGFVRVKHVEKSLPSGVAIVLDLLGPSLEDLWWACTCGTCGFSSLTTLRLANNLLRLLDSLQRAGIAHRDIQPANILLGRLSDSGRYLPHLIDFGIAMELNVPTQQPNGVRPRDKDDPANKGTSHPTPRDDVVISSPATMHAFSGTPRFASVSALVNHGGGNQAADDLESLCYTLAFLRTGSAPWPERVEDGAKTQRGAHALAEVKASISPQLVCGSNLLNQGDPAADAIGKLLEHARSKQKNQESPNYAKCRLIVKDALDRMTKNGSTALDDWEQNGIQWSRTTGALEHALYGHDPDYQY